MCCSFLNLIVKTTLKSVNIWWSYRQKLVGSFLWLTAYIEPDIERVQALTDISRSALRCHSNETRASIANPPDSAQLGAPPTILPTYIRVHGVVWECSEGQTDSHTDTQTAVANIHFASASPHTKCNKCSAVAEMGDRLATIHQRYRQTGETDNGMIAQGEPFLSRELC